ncbi:MAG: O-antigen ligase family protein, partial [Trebonia sp.]
YILVGLIIAIALGVIVFRVDLQWVGVAAACAACFTLTWNGWFVGPLRPGDVLILVALLCFVLGNPNRAFTSPPWWVKQLALVIIVVAVVQIYFPPDPGYLSRRIVLNATGVPVASATGTLYAANLSVAFKFIVAVAAVPLAFVGATLVDRRAVRWLAISSATGAALSGWAAILDYFGASVSTIVTGYPNLHGRQLGFSNQPNFLAAGLVIAVPLAFWMLVSYTRRDRVIGAVSMVGIVLGVFASGSRGGAVCTVLVLAMSVVLHRRTRGYAVNLALGAVVFVGVVALAVPSFGSKLLSVTRLGGGASTQGSDSVRALVGAQGVRDFHHSPLAGIGLQASFDASQVYLQELASGGLLLFIGMSAYMLGAMWAAGTLIRRSELACALLAALIIMLALDFFEGDLTDRFYYVPAAILIALMQTVRDEDGEQKDPAVGLVLESVSRRELS